MLFSFYVLIFGRTLYSIIQSNLINNFIEYSKIGPTAKKRGPPNLELKEYILKNLDIDCGIEESSLTMDIYKHLIKTLLRAPGTGSQTGPAFDLRDADPADHQSLGAFSELISLHPASYQKEAIVKLVQAVITHLRPVVSKTKRPSQAKFQKGQIEQSILSTISILSHFIHCSGDISKELSGKVLTVYTELWLLLNNLYIHHKLCHFLKLKCVQSAIKVVMGKIECLGMSAFRSIEGFFEYMKKLSGKSDAGFQVNDEDYEEPREYFNPLEDVILMVEGSCEKQNKRMILSIKNSLNKAFEGYRKILKTSKRDSLLGGDRDWSKDANKEILKFFKKVCDS